jgi:hypothetical protein
MCNVAGTYIITIKMLHLMQQLKLRELLSLLQQVVLAALVLTEFGSEWGL